MTYERSIQAANFIGHKEKNEKSCDKKKTVLFNVVWAAGNPGD